MRDVEVKTGNKSSTPFPRCRARFLVPAIAALISLSLFLLFGCSSPPENPVWSNPLDPHREVGGDPFELVGIATDNTVLLTWQQPTGPDIADYVVLYSLDNQTYGALGEPIPHESGRATGTYSHSDPAPNAVNYYKVQARNSDGFATDYSSVHEAHVNMPPLFEALDGTSTPTRFVTLRIKAPVGELLEVAEDTLFENPSVGPNDPDGDWVSVAWNLGTGRSGDTKTLYLRSKGDEYVSERAQLTYQFLFNPRPTVVGGSTVASKSVDLQISDITGVIGMRFSRNEGELSSLPWEPPVEIFRGFELGDEPTTQTIHAEFIGDIMDTVRNSVTVAPADLSNANFVIAGDDEVIGNTIVQIHSSDATASQMRLSESQTFVDASWVDYADTVFFTLSEEEGLKTVYGQYRTDWTVSPIVWDHVILVTQPLEIGFYAPLDSQAVRGGTRLMVAGFSRQATDAPAIDRVEVNLAGGDDVQASGTQEWSIPWDIPTFAADTTVTLLARAVDTADEEATAVIHVTITQLVVNILNFAAGDTIPGGGPMTITGTSSSLLGGPPIESLKVTLAGSEVTLSEEFAAWAATLDLADPGGYVAADLIATVTAGSESAADTVAVTVGPAP